MPIANLLMERTQFQSQPVQEISRRLEHAGILSFRITVEGGGDPEMELNGVSYFGEEEINAAIDAFVESEAAH